MNKSDDIREMIGEASEKFGGIKYYFKTIAGLLKLVFGSQIVGIIVQLAIAFVILGEAKALLRIADQKMNAKIQIMQNEWTRLDQKHDSLRRLNDSVNTKIYILKLQKKLE